MEACINGMKHISLDERCAMVDQIRPNIMAAEQTAIKTSKKQILALTENLEKAHTGLQEAGGDMLSIEPFTREVTSKLRSSCAARKPELLLPFPVWPKNLT